MKKELIREEILKFLQWEDSNGCYLDENTKLEGFEPISYEESLIYFYGVLFGNEPLCLNLDELFDMDFEEVVSMLKINYIKDNINAYDYANEFVDELVSSNNKLEVYEKIIKAI